MLDIRTAFKVDLQAKPTELVYGPILRLSGEFLQETNEENCGMNDFLLKLRKAMRNLRPQSYKRHRTPATFEYKDLPRIFRVFQTRCANTVCGFCNRLTMVYPKSSIVRTKSISYGLTERPST
ncbi:hypothetical protein ACFW04_004647 [Cataglyphis niger]